MALRLGHSPSPSRGRMTRRQCIATTDCSVNATKVFKFRASCSACRARVRTRSRYFRAV